MWDSLGTSQATNIVSLVLVLATGAYVYLTHKIASANSLMARQMLAQQENISRPVLAANIEVRSQVLFVLVIRNTGASVATDIRLSLDRDFFRFGEKTGNNLRDLPVFREQPFTLASGDALRFDLAQGFVIFADGADPNIVPPRFNIVAKYKSPSKDYSEIIAVDLAPYRMTNWPKSEIALEIEKLTKALKQ